jgi:hypothetical protein
MFSRETPFTRLAVGDIFHATDVSRSLIALVTEVTETAIHARNVMGDGEYAFDRITGIAKPTGRGVPTAIDAIEPLPMEIYAVILAVDRKMRLTMKARPGLLSEVEKSALVFANEYYEKHVLPSRAPR